MRSAEIIGGGIGGLALGGLLRQSGDWQVQIHERAAALPTTGTTLGMWPAAMATLDRLGIGTRIRALGNAQRAGRILRPDGSQIAAIDSKETIWLINRPELVSTLAERAGKIDFDSTVTDWRAVAGNADLVVGADGIHSPTRSALTAAELKRPGLTIWRGSADLELADLIETWGPGAMFGMTPRPGGKTNWFATVTQLVDDAPAEVPELFRSWHRRIGEVLDQIEPESLHRHEMLTGPALPSYVYGRVVLIGDAAHAMRPNLGRGACETLVDAAVLAEQLAAGPVPQALAGYQRARYRPTRNLVRASELMGRMSTARRFLGVRDRVARLATRMA